MSEQGTASADPSAPTVPPSLRDSTSDQGALASVQSLLTIVTIAIFIITFLVQPFRIPSGSMENTLLVGDFLLVNKQVFAPAGRFSAHFLPYEPVQTQDIIVFHYPVDPSIHLVKRVVAVPGDTLHLERGLVFVNGEQLHEPYAIYRPTHPDSYRDGFPAMRVEDPAIEPEWRAQIARYVHQGELTVPPDSYFALGDNRNDSQDSRYWGFVPMRNIVGQPLLIYFSLNDAPAGSPSVLSGAAAPAPKGPFRWLLERLQDFARWDRSFRLVH